jgi:membrane-associated protease RseP (regulator of RpoE activity)
MGAFINMKERPRNKRVLFDIGIAGPLSGLIVAIPVLIIGLALSQVGPVQDTVYKTADGVQYSSPDDNMMEGNSLLYLGLKYAIKGKLLPEPVSYGVKSPLEYWLGFIFIGKPIPFGGDDVLMHQVAWAGWIGILVTFLNLIPAGQLDGGHILYSLFGRRVRYVWQIILILLLVMGLFWTGWFIWAALIFLLGRTHAEPLDLITELDPRRKVLALVMLVVFILVFTPVPFTVF